MASSRVQRLWSWLITPSPEQIVDEDRRTTDLVGLRLPVRASVVVTVTTMVLLIDFSRVLLPGAVVQLGRAPDGLRAIALERVVLFALVPLAVILLGFRDRPARYGWTLGDGRAGAVLSLAGCILMTPIVLWFATLPDVRAYYAVSAAPPQDIVLTNVIDLTTAEFLFRGFLMLTLVRAIGPIGVLIAVMPFAFAHVGKPALELLSTLGGGLAYGWLAWRTRSILWGSIAHVYILSLVTVVAGQRPVV
ncbi:MAG TPA: CPBP family intramembrane glutamic endopeptidase [Candidatus Limnocylindrales bacterium]|nr:CPBP family intramembrane glutamic endopeptidase [Candidatus Limnocylindrales bacterium]